VKIFVLSGDLFVHQKNLTQHRSPPSPSVVGLKLFVVIAPLHSIVSKPSVAHYVQGRATLIVAYHYASSNLLAPRFSPSSLPTFASLLRSTFSKTLQNVVTRCCITTTKLYSLSLLICGFLVCVFLSRQIYKSKVYLTNQRCILDPRSKMKQ